MMLSLSDIRKKRWQDLTKDKIEYLRMHGILNGFGGAGQSRIVRWLIGYLLGDFDKAIPDKHDFAYWVGVRYCFIPIGTYPRIRKKIIERRRKECDEGFYEAMLYDIRSRYDQGRISKWGVVYKSFIALGAYSAIRLYGAKYFNYE